MTIREFNESPKAQGVDERVAYKVITTRWGGNPSSAAVAIKLAGIDESETYLDGEASIEGDVIITPLVVGLESGNRYKLEVKWESSGNTYEAYGLIIAGGIY